MQIDAPAAAPVLLVEDVRSPTSPYTAILSRADLNDRLHVVPVDVAPRRARDGDVIEIAETLLSIYSAREGRKFRRLAPETCEVFRRYHWPGNLRQLQNVLRNAVVLHDGPEVTLSMLPMELRMPESTGRGDVVYPESSTGRVAGFAEPARDPGPEAPGAGDGGGAEEELATAAEAFVGRSLAEVERLVIEATIRACGGSLPKAARVLGVSPSTLYRKRAGWTD